jgi:hypothetical protein
MASSWSGQSISLTSRYYMKQASDEGIPFLTSTFTMPFFNMFKSKRSRSKSAPSPPDRLSDVDGSEFFDQEPTYHRTPSSSGLSRSVAFQGPQLHAGSRAQRYPYHASSFHNSGAERYAHAPTDDDEVRTTSPLLFPIISHFYLCNIHTRD